MNEAFTSDQIEIILIVCTTALGLLSISVITTVIIINYKMRQNEKS